LDGREAVGHWRRRPSLTPLYNLQKKEFLTSAGSPCACLHETLGLKSGCLAWPKDFNTCRVATPFSALSSGGEGANSHIEETGISA